MLSYSSLEGGNVSYPLLYDRSPQNFVTESNKSFYLLTVFQVSWDAFQF